MLSVITSSLNASSTIAATIESVHAEASPSVEHIVIDGGSTDGTREIIESYSHLIDQVVFERDDGIADAFNKGISRAGGEFICILNADDRLEPGVLGRILPVLEGASEDILFGDVIYEDPSTGFRHVEHASVANLHRLMTIFHPAMLVRRSLHARLGGYEPSYRLAMDSEFAHRALAAGATFRHLPLPLATMRLDGRSHRSLGRSLLEFRRSAIAHGLQGRAGSLATLTRQWLLHSLLRIPGFRPLWLTLRRRSADHRPGS